MVFLYGRRCREEIAGEIYHTWLALAIGREMWEVSGKKWRCQEAEYASDLTRKRRERREYRGDAYSRFLLQVGTAARRWNIL
jgi:hypothetical protein